MCIEDVRHKNTVMIWGVHIGTSPLAIYSQILIHHAITSAKSFGDGFIFQHDSDPKHKTKEMTRKLPKRVQAALKNKRGHTKY